MNLHATVISKLVKPLMYTNIKEDTLRNHFCWGKKRGQKCLSNYSSTIYSPEWNQAFKIFMSPPFKTQGTHTWRQCLCLICFGLELGLTKYVHCTDKHNKLFSISFLISIATLIAAKGQLISKGILNSSKKWMKKLLFCFLEEFEDTKKTFWN